MSLILPNQARTSTVFHRMNKSEHGKTRHPWAFVSNSFLIPLSLDLQSEMINLTFENKLIWAPITLEKGAIVVDSGTGSGKKGLVYFQKYY